MVNLLSKIRISYVNMAWPGYNKKPPCLQQLYLDWTSPKGFT